MSLKTWFRWTGMVLAVTAFLAGCASAPPPSAVQTAPPLRVGVVREFPPLIFRSGDAYAGAEADFARLLSVALGRPVYFVQRNFDDQIPALLASEIDIIMAGMTISDERKLRIAFSDYYMKGGLALAVRAGQGPLFDTLPEVFANAGAVGVVGGTVAEAYVRRTFPSNIRILLLGRPSDAVYELSARRIDVYVDDTPSIAWLAASNAAEVQPLFLSLESIYYGWGISKGNPELLARVNAILAQWKQDGTLDRVITRWLPNVKGYR